MKRSACIVVVAVLVGIAGIAGIVSIDLGCASGPADPAAGSPGGVSATPGEVRLVVHADRPGHRIPKTLVGIFFEDINLGADGGLYAELVKNRSFEFPDGLLGWSESKEGEAKGSLALRDEAPVSAAAPHYLCLQAETAGYGVANEGFRGIGVRSGEEYVFSTQARVQGDSSTVPPLRVELVAVDGKVLGTAKLHGLTTAWAKVSVTLRARAKEERARLRLTLEGPAILDLDQVSLFPRDTWKGRPGGLRADLVQWLADLRPGFVRFPGGCIVEGRDLSRRYQWKNTIGPPEERRLLINRWNDEFRHRPTPDYFQTFGLGFHEYFVLSEDLGAEPLPILNCGMACQFNTGELVPLDALEPYIQDALDLIEYANGPVTSAWGSRRAAMGHPEPFGLEFLGIGNEQWGPAYIERYERFARAIRAKYPEVKLVASAGPRPADDLFHFAWPKLRALGADIIDEHCYDRPAWFLDNAGRYDAYDRTGPKVFMGEYAAQSVKTVSPENRNDWGCALAEAVFLTGLERNSDMVAMTSYAPLFGHEHGWQWRPNLIWFDNLRSYGTPSYYVQQAFSRNRGDVLVPLEVEGQEVPSSRSPGLHAVASRDEENGELILKVVNTASVPMAALVRLEGVEIVASEGVLTLLRGETLADENTLEEPTRVAPRSRAVQGLGKEFRRVFEPSSLTILRVDVGG